MGLIENERELLSIAEEFDGLLPSDRIDFVRELANVGEPGVGLEILLANISDYDLRLKTDTLDRLRRLGTEMNIDPKWWHGIQLPDDGPDSGQ